MCQMLADLASDTPADAVGPDLLGQGIPLHREIQEGGERRGGGTGGRGREGRGGGGVQWEEGTCMTRNREGERSV